jgi:PPIC-type PPIASE domain
LIPRLLREPLLQFLVLGAILFVLYSLVDRRGVEAPEKIVVSTSRIANLADGFARTWRRPPSKEELQDLIEDYVRDEVFYRAGRAAGLDRDDVIIRRRVRQKMEFLAEEISVPEPSESELGAFLAANPDRFRTEDRLSFHHVFLSPSRRAGTIDQDLKQVGAAVSGAALRANAAELGDPFLLGAEFNAISQRDVAGIFGDSFARWAFSVEQGRWQGPIASTYGQHFVFITDRSKGSVPPLDTVRAAVVREWTNARRSESEQKLYRSLRDRYEITVETEPPQTTAARP